MKQNRYAGEQTVVYTFFNTFCCQRPTKRRAAKIISSFKLFIFVIGFRYNKRVKDIQDAAAHALATRYATKVNSLTRLLRWVGFSHALRNRKHDT